VPGCRRWTICTENQCLGGYILPALIGKEEQSMRHLPILQLGLRCGTPIGGVSLPQAINDKRQTLSASVSKAAGGGWNSRAGAGSCFFFRPQLNFLHMRNICSKTVQPRINILNLPNYSTFTAYKKHMQSMDSVLLCRNSVRATCDGSEDCEMR